MAIIRWCLSIYQCWPKPRKNMQNLRKQLLQDFGQGKEQQQHGTLPLRRIQGREDEGKHTLLKQWQKMTKTYPYAPCTIFTYQTGWFCSGKCWDSYSTHDGICNLAMQMSTDLRIPPESTRADLTAVTNRYWPGLKRTKFPWRNPTLSNNAGDPTEKRSFGGDMMGLLLDDTGCVALSENDCENVDVPEIIIFDGGNRHEVCSLCFVGLLLAPRNCHHWSVDPICTSQQRTSILLPNKHAHLMAAAKYIFHMSTWGTSSIIKYN